MSSGKYKLCLRASLADMLLGPRDGRGWPRLAADDIVDRREAHDLVSRDLPRLLDDPGERPVLPVRLLLDLAQHVLRKVEALLPLVGARHQAASGLPCPRRLVRRAMNSTLCLDSQHNLVKQGLRSLSALRTGDSCRSYRLSRQGRNTVIAESRSAARESDSMGSRDSPGLRGFSSGVSRRTEALQQLV